MRANRLSGSEGGGALNPLSLPLSSGPQHASRRFRRHRHKSRRRLGRLRMGDLTQRGIATPGDPPEMVDQEAAQESVEFGHLRATRG